MSEYDYDLTEQEFKESLNKLKRSKDTYDEHRIKVLKKTKQRRLNDY